MMYFQGGIEMTALTEMGQRAKDAAAVLAKVSSEQKNKALLEAAKALRQSINTILAANAQDLQRGRENGMSEALLDRLMVNPARIDAMAEGLEQIVTLDDPIGEILSMKKRPNGLMIGQMRVPFGVIGIIYESRPNVTADAFGLCFKTGNAVILRGGSDAISSNTAIADILRKALVSAGMPEDSIKLVTDTSHETAREMMRLNRYIDVLIPRGGARLIRTVVENSTVPVIETGTGNCHVYVDEFADLDMAVNIIVNAKTQRLGTCNTCESLVVHKNVANDAIPKIAKALFEKDVEIRGDEEATKLVPQIHEAAEEDWGREYLDRIISLKVVDTIDEAITHINRYNTGHSEAIVTKDYAHAQQFLREVDAAAVYVNASTRFTDGFEFGFGAEIGISTQKLHARGPMGLLALTSTKYIIYGDGQIRS